MNQRIITTVFALLFFIPFLLIGSWPLEILLAVLAIIGMYELIKIKSIQPYSLGALLSYLGVAMIVFSHRLFPMVSDHWSLYDGVLGIVLLLFVYLLFSKQDYDVEDVSVSLMGMLYVGTGFHAFTLLRERNIHLLFLILFVIWATDSGAYLIGRKIGKKKLAPAISPNKTVEGSLGGVAVAMLVAALYLTLVNTGLPFWTMLALAAVVSVAGQLGDLVESAIKRHYGVKDSGSLLPGHGGILDRFDSLIFVMVLISVINVV
ncbi:phosphatidate cytidylyltransferase [Atopococcus tabaci]|uniref:phosphatidate cytidylyltransferase n=1 Tax=Atopococcus tabaci TaxID=269774 RepID=UPI00040C2F08|nr:phosphatidate cytidylyltransferase [Atopococcus tabaci]